MKLLIKNAKILTAKRDRIVNILIKGRKIAKITTEDIDHSHVIDAKKNYVLPGIIDPHVHLREPGLTHKENFETGSMAAAAGGITTILDMPNTMPETITVKALRQKRRLAKKKCIVNFGFHFGASADDNINQIRKIRRIASVKLFMNVSTGKMLIEDDKLLEKVFENARFVSVHAEGEMVRKAIRLANKYKTRLYLCHISHASEIGYLRSLKNLRIFAEVTPHHLFLTDKDAKILGPYGEMKPNLKIKEDQKALWQAVSEDLIDTIGTDHAPHSIEEKESKNPPSGVTGLETALPLMLNEVNKSRITLKKLVRLMSYNPANIFGIKNKGKIEVGYDADLVIVDMDLKKKVNNSDLLTKWGWSPFNGKILKGWPITTIVNGRVIYNNGDIVTKYKGKEIKYIKKRDAND